MRHFDPDLLRTLVVFADTGTLARTAEIVGRTPSAVTAQMQRLEEVAGVPLLEAHGRRRGLTAAGERLVAHARRLLAAHDEAWLSVAAVLAEGRIGLGLTQDFAGDALPPVLNRVARSHPRVRLDLRIGRTVELEDAFDAQRIDVLVAMRRAVRQDEVAVVREPMRWLVAGAGLAAGAADELPIAVLDPPCGFRDAALKALDAAQRPYRIAATSPSLAGLAAAVRAGIAVTVRTDRWCGAGMAVAPADLHLPPLPDAEFSIRLRDGASASTARVATVLAGQFTSSA